jgi:DNA polymerase III alpha subunit
MLFEYEIVSTLTKKETEKFIENIPIYKSIKEILQHMLDTSKISKSRQTIIQNLIRSIEHPPYSLIDKIEWLSDTENSLLGTAITCSKLDTYDVSMSNCNCKNFKTSIMTENIIIAGEISNVNFIKTKNGKNPGQDMAFLTIEDQYGSLDSVIFFPEQLTQYKHHLYANNVLIFCGNKSKTKDGLVVNKCFIPSA